MPRSSRHRSHRSRKHSRDRSESEDDEVSRDKRSREEEPAASSGVRVSRDPESEKRMVTLVAPGGKDAAGISNGDAFLEHGKKRKERVDDAVDTDRWNGGEEEDYKKAKGGDNLGLEKSSKLKHVTADPKVRSSRRREGSNERNEDSLGKYESESGKRKTEKDSSRRDSSSSLCKDVKEDRERGSGKDRERASERDRERVPERERDHESERDNKYERDKERTERDKERCSEREKYRVSEKERDRVSLRERDRDREANDVVYENYDYSLHRKRGFNVGSKDDERAQRKDVKLNELQVQDVLPNTGLLKGFDKHTRDGSEENKWLQDDRDGDDRRLSSRDDNSKHRSYKNGIHEDGKLADKKLDDVDRDHRHRDEKSREERARDRDSERSESKPAKDEVKIMDSRYRKTKHDNENNHDEGQSVNDHNVKPMNYRGKKRFSDEKEDFNEFKPRNLKEQQEDDDKLILTSRIDSQTDRSRSDYRQSDKLDSSPRNNRQKIASSSSAYPVKDQSRDSIKHVESAWKESSSEDRSRPSLSRSTSSGVHERVSFTRSEKVKLMAEIHSSEVYGETAASTKYERAPMSDAHSSPNQRRERSSSISDRRFSDRTGARRSIDTEGQKTSSLKDRDRAEKVILDDSARSDACNRESTPAGSSINRTGHFTGNSPNHLLPPPAMRLGLDSPSVLGSYEDERSQIGDRKSYNRYKRTGDLTFGRGHLNAWKNPTTWPSPLGNGFIPLHHGVPPGFHTPVAQFSAPPMFGVRPPMDLSHGGASYRMHDVSDSFHGHGRPFGWHNAVDQSCPPHMQLWDGSNGAFGDEPHMYGRSDWDHNRNLLSTRGWEMGADMWKTQNGSMNVDASTPKKEHEQLINPLADETQVIQRSQHTSSQNDKSQLECLPTESLQAKHTGDSPHGKNASEGGPQRLQNKRSSVTSNVSGNESVNFVASYLSRVDISPILADSDLYKKCTLLHGISNETGTPIVTDHIHFQDKNGSSRKMSLRVKTKIRSLLPAVKESIFQSAISLYKKQQESSKVKLHIPLICSEEKKEPAEELGKCEEDVQVDEENKSLEEILPPDDAGTDINMETQDDATTNEHANFHSAGADDKMSIFSSGAVVCASDSPSAEIGVNLSRIPNSPESTH